MSWWGRHHSTILCALLDDVTGNEEAVGMRQDYCRIHDFLKSSHLPMNYYYTGSRAEGLDIPGSDNDVMGDINETLNIKVVQSLHDISDASICNVFLLCTENVNPGFAFLCGIQMPKFCPFVTQSVQCINDVRYLSSDLMVDITLYFSNLLNISNATRKRQGPSLEHWFEYQDLSKEGSDFVLSLHCQFWPNNALEWIRRPRHYGWPTSNDISTIYDFGCHLVPIGYPISETKSLEWRISFSVAERTLVWSFNHVQLQCYAVMKIILKEFIKKKCTAQNQVLCSYFIKTFLFWKYETNDLDFWCKGNFRKCIKYLLAEFSQCIHEGVLRHYFLPQFNLLLVKLTREAKTELLQLYDIIIQSDVRIFKECKTLQTVWSKFLSTDENQMDILHTAKKTIFVKNDKLMRILNTISIRFDSPPDTSNVIKNLLNAYNMNFPLMYNHILEFFPKGMTMDQKINHMASLPCKTCLKYFVVSQLRVQKHIRSLIDLQNNKDLYILQRIIQDHVSFDLTTSKLWYSMVLLRSCDYTATLNIVNQMLSSVRPFALYESASENSESIRLYLDKFLNSQCTTLERAKKAWVNDIISESKFNMTEALPLAFQIELFFTYQQQPVIVSPFACAYYILFLCYHQLGQYDNRNRALAQLIEVVHNREQCGRFRHHAYNIAGHCLLVTLERDRARDMFNRSRQFLRSMNPVLGKYNSATWYISNFCV